MIEPERLRSQKTTFGPENNWFKISYLEIYLLISDFLAESPEANKNWQKSHFTIQFHSKNLTYFTNLKNNIVKKYTPATQPKNYSLYKFFSKHVSGWCLKTYLHCIISRRLSTEFSKLLEIKSLCIPAYLRKTIFVPEM